MLTLCEICGAQMDDSEPIRYKGHHCRACVQCMNDTADVLLGEIFKEEGHQLK
jgi:coenzyme F420-reducing hydrogenase beta subunit